MPMVKVSTSTYLIFFRSYFGSDFPLQHLAFFLLVRSHVKSPIFFTPEKTLVKPCTFHGFNGGRFFHSHRKIQLENFQGPKSQIKNGFKSSPSFWGKNDIYIYIYIFFLYIYICFIKCIQPPRQLCMYTLII